MLYSRVYGTRHHQATYCMNDYKKLGDKKARPLRGSSTTPRGSRLDGCDAEKHVACSVAVFTHISIEKVITTMQRPVWKYVGNIIWPCNIKDITRRVKVCSSRKALVYILTLRQWSQSVELYSSGHW